MKRYDNFSELLKENGIEFSSHIKYAQEVLKEHLCCTGSEIEENKDVEPSIIFEISIDDRVLKIGVTSVKQEEYVYNEYYWIKED